MLESLAELTKSLLIPGTLTFLLFGLTIGLLLAYASRRTRSFALPWLTVLAVSYWLASVPVVADLLATRFHARDALPLTRADAPGAQAIVVLGAGIRGSYVAGGHTVPIPDPQTVFNAVEGARLYALFDGALPVVASGGHQPEASADDNESLILRDWLMRMGVPAERITLESGSRTTREQAALVAPLLKSHHWARFILVTPAVQGPRAAAVFRRAGVDPISAPAPFLSEAERAHWPGWIPTGAGLRASERATYDYLAWVYYWMRRWI